MDGDVSNQNTAYQFTAKTLGLFLGCISVTKEHYQIGFPGSSLKFQKTYIFGYIPKGMQLR